MTALAALQREARWATATPQQREVLKRIALQRDRWTAARQAREQALAQRAARTSVPVDAPLAERLMVFARLHPVATAGEEVAHPHPRGREGLLVGLVAEREVRREEDHAGGVGLGEVDGARVLEGHGAGWETKSRRITNPNAAVSAP